ncbi:hypothetical protein ACQKCU_05635 [Heyndrickxia sporothermodurans]
MSVWRELLQDSQDRWETNADYWDDYMGKRVTNFIENLFGRIRKSF